MNRDEIQEAALGMGVNYEGIFNLSDLLFLIDSFFRKRGYIKKVENHTESYTENGRNINLKIRPYKKAKSNTLEIQVTINIQNIVDIRKQIDNLNAILQKGKVSITIDAFVLESKRGGFETRPEQLFIKTIFDKFLLGGGGKDYSGMVASEAKELKNEINAFLNLYKFL
ncbi:MAG: hypothetical protein QXM96_02590 [Candidatus Woesearchaeota archaeon]